MCLTLDYFPQISVLYTYFLNSPKGEKYKDTLKSRLVCVCLCDLILTTFLRSKGGGHGRHHAYYSMLARRTWASLVSFLAHLTDKYFKNIFRTPPKFPRNSPSSTCKATCFKLNFVLRLYSREILHINVFLNKFFNPP